MMEQDLKEGLSHIGKKVGEVDVKVSGVLSLLKGNELNKDDRGILGDVDKLKKDVEMLKKFKDKVIYIMVGMGLPAGVGIWEFLKSVMSK